MKITFPESFPILESERLILRPVEPEDNYQLLDIYGLPEVMKFRGADCFKSLDQANELIDLFISSFINQHGIRWALCFKDDHTLIGSCGYKTISYHHFRGEIGYELHPKFWNRGLMTEALKQITRFGFNMGLHTIEANIAPDNYASEKVLCKLGFIKEAHFRENYFYNGEFMDSVIYSRLNTDQL